MRVVPVQCNESKDGLAARVSHHCRTRLGKNVLGVSLKARLQVNDLTDCDDCWASAIAEQHAQCTRLLARAPRAFPWPCASLRAAFAPFCALANTLHVERLSAAATRQLLCSGEGGAATGGVQGGRSSKRRFLGRGADGARWALSVPRGSGDSARVRSNAGCSRRRK